ncbi:holo-[acyl-carrier-protein] synthase [Candidatus Poribacteria bacterium]|nr:holo-[acyl-carrier-protein] synthase [Candidatus Poribacteria bacterium]
MSFTDIATGIDIIEVPRVRAALQRWGDRFERRIFTEGERAYCSRRPKPYQSYAARFAAKEAAMKALGTGWRGLDWKDIEVSREPSGRPGILFHGRASRIYDRLGGEVVRVSLSHTEEHAVAHVVLLLR